MSAYDEIYAYIRELQRDAERSLRAFKAKLEERKERAVVAVIEPEGGAPDEELGSVELDGRGEIRKIELHDDASHVSVAALAEYTRYAINNGIDHLTLQAKN